MDRDGIKPAGTVSVDERRNYVDGNMSEISTERKITPGKMCLLLVKEYNRRIVADNDASLQVAENPSLTRADA